MTEADKKGGKPDFATFTQIAERLNELGLVSRPITRQGVRYIADHDPGWPVPKEEWIKAGTAWLMDWNPIEKFFRERTTPRGRGPVVRPADNTQEGSEPEQ